MRRRTIAGSLAATLLLGCATGGPGGGSGRIRGADFPTPDALEDLRKAPDPTAVFGPDAIDIASWTLRGPFPGRVSIDPWADDTPMGRSLSRAAARRPGLVVLTEAMHCVARETGRFHQAHGVPPPEGLARTIRGLCRCPEARVRFQYLEGEVPAEVSDEELLAAWDESVQDTIRSALVGGPRTTGAWLGTDGGRALVVVAAGERLLHLEPLGPAEPDGTVVLEGESLEPAQLISGAVTRGYLGFAHCEADPEVALPRFRFRCPVAAADRRAWLALSVLPPNRVIGRVAVELLLWPAGAEDPVYERPVYAVSRQAWDPETAAAGFVALLNETRQAIGLAPLVYDEAQSEMARDLAPHFFEAMLGGDEDGTADLVMLGLLAGWQIDGIVQSAHFAATWVPDSNDVGRLLSEALDYPMLRAALLDEDAERIAVGPLLEADLDNASMAMLVGTYVLFSAEEHAASAESVFERLVRERAAIGRAAPWRIDALTELSADMAAAVQGGLEPREALGELLHRSGEELRRSVRGWILESSALEDIEFPRELVEERSISVSIGVSSYRPEGSAWGHHVVLIVAAEPGRGI